MLRETLIEGNCPGPYQVSVADLQGDGKPDVLVTCPGRGLIQWYAAPDWRKRPIRTDLRPGALDVAAYDLDGDGELELAVLDEFHLTPSTTGGRVLWLDRRGSLDQEWTLHEIDTVPTAHRPRRYLDAHPHRRHAGQRPRPPLRRRRRRRPRRDPRRLPRQRHQHQPLQAR